VTRRLDEVVAVLDPKPDRWLAAAGRAVLERSEW
jgi:hypothetical protein